MLKNFWECVNGSPVDNEVCRTKLNRGSQNTAWPKSDTHNEIMLRLPRALRHGNLIEINGTFQANTQRIRLNLTKGLDKPDIKSIACWTEINFAEGYVSGSKNVQLDKDPPKGEDLKKDLFPGSKFFNFTIKVTANGDSSELDLFVFQYRLSTGTLKLDDITFLNIDGDINEITDLKFTYA